MCLLKKNRTSQLESANSNFTFVLTIVEVQFS